MYTPPTYNAVDFDFTAAYSVPTSTTVDFDFGATTGTTARRRFFIGAS